jgi:acetoacetyl-CoA synthetase
VTLWDDFYQPGGEPRFVPVPFDHPLYILYSSGTTGVPKCIVHSTGGVLLQHPRSMAARDLAPATLVLLHHLRLDDVELAGLGLAVGAVVLYDGSPFHPAGALLDLIDDERISVFGTSPKYLATLESSGSSRAKP